MPSVFEVALSLLSVRLRKMAGYMLAKYTMLSTTPPCPSRQAKSLGTQIPLRTSELAD